MPQLLTRFFFGERGPVDIAVTRAPEASHFRLPNQRPHSNAFTLPIAVPLAIAGYGMFLVVHGALRLPDESRGRWGVGLAIGGMVVAALAIMARMRVDWHYEITLNPGDLRVYCASSGQRWRTVKLDLAPVRSLEIRTDNGVSLLHAISADGTRSSLVKGADPGRIADLAQLLAAEYALLSPGLPPWVVLGDGVDSFARAVHAEQPPGSGIVLTRQETGVSLDFPQREQERARQSRHAWQTFEVGMIAFLAALIFFAVCRMNQAPEWLPIAGMLFIAGFVIVYMAGGQAVAAWQLPGSDDGLRQLSVADNLLIRTTRDHRKQVWYRQEIHAILVEPLRTPFPDPSSAAVVEVCQVYVELTSSEKIQLSDVMYPWSEPSRHVEIEWIAHVLRQALFGAKPSASAPSTTTAFQVLQPPVESHIAPRQEMPARNRGLIE